MRSSSLIGLIAAASVLAACSGQNSSVMSHPGAVGNSRVNHSFSHALVAPGHFGQMAIMPGAPRHAGSMHPSFTATTPCTYLTDNFSGDVRLYNRNRSLAGDFGAAIYGWGALASKTTIYLGRNDGSGDLDMYTPCTNNFLGTLQGNNDGGAAYGVAGFKALGKPGYATDWPIGTIEYWATGTGTSVPKTDPNTPLPYFLDIDSTNHLWVVGYDASFANEIVDRCSKTVTSCTTMIVESGGFPGGVQVDSNNQVYVNNQFGVLTSYNCAVSGCPETASFVYNNGSNPLDYTATALDPILKARIWGANIYFCSDGCSFGLASDAQPQTLPLSSATLKPATPGWDNTETLGVARFKPDTP